MLNLKSNLASLLAIAAGHISMVSGPPSRKARSVDRFTYRYMGGRGKGTMAFKRAALKARRRKAAK